MRGTKRKAQQHDAGLKLQATVGEWLVMCETPPPLSDPYGLRLRDPPSHRHIVKRRRIFADIQPNTRVIMTPSAACTKGKGIKGDQRLNGRGRVTRASSRAATATVTVDQSASEAEGDEEEEEAARPKASPGKRQPAPRPQTRQIVIPTPPASDAATTQYSGSSPRKGASRSPTKPSHIVKREDLVHLRPSVTMMSWSRAQASGVVAEDSVARLWQQCKHTDPDLSSNTYLTAENRSYADVRLRAAATQAGDCITDGLPESQWISMVIIPILSLLAEIAPATDPVADNRLGVFDIRTVEIQPAQLLPVARKAHLFKALDRKIDIAVGLHLSERHRKSVQDADTRTKSINQTTTFVHYKPLFLHVEVKRNYQPIDPVIQLAAWAAAEFMKRQLEGWDMKMPVLLCEIEGPMWRLYAAVSSEPQEDSTISEDLDGLDDDNEQSGVDETGEEEVGGEEPVELADSFQLHILGPMDLGATGSFESTCALFTNLCYIAQWGRTNWLNWWQKNVLKSCKKPKKNKKKTQY